MRELRRLFGFVRPYGGLALLALTMLATLVALDLAIPRLIQRIIDEGILRHDRGLILRTAALMLAISAASAAIAVANNVFSVRVGESVARDLRDALFTRIQRYSFENLDQQRTGQLMVRLGSDVSAAKTLTQVSLRIGTRAPLLMLGSIVLMITTSRRLAFVMLPLLIVTSGLIAFFVLRMEPLFRSVQQRLDALNDVLQENIAGVRLVKALVRADFERERFEHTNEAMTRRAIMVMNFVSTMTPALTMCVNIGIVVVVWGGGLQSIRGELSVGEVVAFTNYMLTTMTPLVMMTMLSNTWAAGLASLHRMGEIFDTQPTVVDAPDAHELPASAPARVELVKVSFTYGGEGNEPVLRDVDLTAEPGETIAILGATGAGKSTLVNLVPRFYDASAGVVRVGGQDVRALTRSSLLRHIAVVPQETLLFSGSVRDNIRYGRPDASEDEVVAAARAAQAHEFVQRLPQGYDTHVEQRGVNLSGGQKQRIAIARALLLRPRILVLDDATSAVDVETEAHIQTALFDEKRERTTLVVAQRISTVLAADRIVVLDEGRIVAQGSHQELLATSDVYREIHDSQLGDR